MTASTLLPLIVGVVAIAFGSIVIIFRRQVAAANAMAQRNFLGKVGDQVASKSSSLGIVVPGAFFIAVGIYGIVFGLWHLLRL